jgi:hypothetical protein
LVVGCRSFRKSRTLRHGRALFRRESSAQAKTGDEVKASSAIKESKALREEVEADVVMAKGAYSPAAVELAGDAARLLMNEVLDWRIVFLDRPLTPPS